MQTAPVIVVADDDPDIRALVTFKLSANGFDVREAVDGDQALELIRQARPALALLDLMMPGLTGFEIIREVRAEDEIKDTKLILITARSRDVDVDAGFSTGADDYIIKPFSPRELVNMVRHLVGGGD